MFPNFLLPDAGRLEGLTYTIDEPNQHMHLIVWSVQRESACPICQQKSGRVHSQHPGAVRRLLDLAGTYNHCELFSFSGEEENDLHAKVIAVDRKVALIGSSNLSRRGLQANHELAVVVEGTEVDVIASALDRLFGSQYLDHIQP